MPSRRRPVTGVVLLLAIVRLFPTIAPIRPAPAADRLVHQTRQAAKMVYITETLIGKRLGPRRLRWRSLGK
jgi:hypothetical protein